MGLSSLNAMRARKRAMEQANAQSEPTPIEIKVEESSPVVDESSISNETKVEERKKKTDAEKLKKKE